MRAEVYHATTGKSAPQRKLSRGRWYPGALTLPDGRAYIVGGQSEPLGGRTGVYERVDTADVFDQAAGAVVVAPQLNGELVEGAYGNWYPGEQAPRMHDCMCTAHCTALWSGPEQAPGAD